MESRLTNLKRHLFSIASRLFSCVGICAKTNDETQYVLLFFPLSNRSCYMLSKAFAIDYPMHLFSRFFCAITS